MEALTLSSPMVIVVTGLPGSGKSFFATQFAQTFGAALVSQDKIRWTLFANHTYSANENAMVSQVADLLITELFHTKKTFVLDGGYNTRTARQALSVQARKNGFRVLTIAVQTEEKTCRRRALKRDARKAGDRYKQSLTGEQFDQAVKAYEEPATVSKDVVVINGKHTYNMQARIVLKKIVEARGGGQVSTSTPAPRTATMPVNKPRGPFVQ